MFAFYYLLRLVGQRLFLPLEYKPHALCPLLKEEYYRKDCPHFISVALLFSNF